LLDDKQIIMTYTYLTIGQDYDSIQEYIRDFVVLPKSNHQKNHLIPATTTQPHQIPHGYMVYTDIQQLLGLDTPINYGSGIEYANGIISQSMALTQVLSNQQHPPPPPQLPSLQIGLWLNGPFGCQHILQDQKEFYQNQIRKLFRYCIIDCATTVSKIYLRIGYEFDNPTFGYTDRPDLYRTTFQYMIQECYRMYSYTACRTKIDFVWHSWAATSYTDATSTASTTSLDDYYPGDEYVDWIGISIFSQFYTPQNLPNHVTPLGNPTTVQYICQYAQQHNKFIMIAESTPFGGIDQLNDPWYDWFVPVLSLVEQYNIHMWSYIYCNWNVLPMWHTAGFGDSRLTQNHTVAELWNRHVVQNPRYMTNSQWNVSQELIIERACCSSKRVQERTTSQLSSSTTRMPKRRPTTERDHGATFYPWTTMRTVFNDNRAVQIQNWMLSTMVGFIIVVLAVKKVVGGGGGGRRGSMNCSTHVNNHHCHQENGQHEESYVKWNNLDKTKWNNLDKTPILPTPPIDHPIRNYGAIIDTFE
jgi:hypothetical protein